jgi:hypothetical protein
MSFPGAGGECHVVTVSVISILPGAKTNKVKHKDGSTQAQLVPGHFVIGVSVSLPGVVCTFIVETRS